MENSIIVDLKDSYGLTCHRITPVTGGWLNLKWMITTDEGEYLVKQFSDKRYSREKLMLVEQALQRQIILKKKGVLCSSIRQCRGHAIRLMDNEIAYMVMEYCTGKIESPNTITTTQMYSLGNACGFMHKEFSQLSTCLVKGFPINNKQVLDSLWENLYIGMLDCSTCHLEEYRKALLAQEFILKQITNEFLDKLPKGISHEDFAADNILFDEDRVSAIIDFDRNHYSYTWHDIGRAILSFALEDNQLNLVKIQAFLEGYSQHLMLTMSNIADALRVSWCIEVPWWIQPDVYREGSDKVVRFKDEMVWLTEHWFELDAMLCS